MNLVFSNLHSIIFDFFNKFTSFCFPRDDLVRAIKKLAILGSGFKVLPLQGRQLVQSVPSELNMDHTAVLQLAEVRTVFIARFFKLVVYYLKAAAI